jgi:prepilin-type N-terminal cleavage/methylation domain-containing protein
MDMATTMITTHSTRHRQRGFSLIEVMISMVVLTIGLLALLATMGVLMAATQISQEDLIARQVASEAMESIFNARDTGQAGFASVANTTASPPGIFLVGALPLLCAGPDGILGTADDTPCTAANGAACPVQCMSEPGPDGILGTADDVNVQLTDFTRSIVITPINATEQLVTITITYNVPNIGHFRTYTLNEAISMYH